jgi:hypothetical protein
MPRVRAELAGPDGWSRRIYPNHRGYRLACCDCGLSHDVRFRVLRVTRYTEGGFTLAERPVARVRVEMRVRRNERSTAQLRRKKYPRR